MQTLQNTTLWLVLLSSVCLVAMWQRWRRAHPHCMYCSKRIRRAFTYCPWCSTQQFHVQRVRPVRHHRTPKRASRDVFVAQEAAMLPHKRPQTIVLPETSRGQTKRQRRSGTVLVPEPYVSSHVPICADCKTVLHEDDTRCWYCDSQKITWKERNR